MHAQIMICQVSQESDSKMLIFVCIVPTFKLLNTSYVTFLAVIVLNENNVEVFYNINLKITFTQQRLKPHFLNF